MSGLTVQAVLRKYLHTAGNEVFFRIYLKCTGNWNIIKADWSEMRIIVLGAVAEQHHHAGFSGPQYRGHQVCVGRLQDAAALFCFPYIG